MDTPNSDEHSSGGSSRRDVLKYAGLAGLAGVAATAAPGAAAGAGFLRAAVSGTHFKLLIDGAAVPGVRAIEGPDSESAVVFDSGPAGITANPGPVSVQSVTVHRDFSSTKEWFNWRKTVLDGKVERKSMSIVFLNDAGKEVARCNLFHCWPTKWVGPSLNAKNSGHATESLEIVFERIELK